MSDEQEVSRRSALGGVAAFTLTSCCLARSAVAQEYHPQGQARLTKIAAHYQEQPKSDESCGSCPYFTLPKGCVVVEGDISPNGWCPMYTRFSPLDRGAHT
jgi:hypothetical protein